MAVNQNAFNINNNNAAAEKQQTYTGGHQSRQQATAFSTGQMGLLSPLGSMASGGEKYEKIYSFFQTTVKRLNEEVKSGSTYHLVKLLKTQAGLNYSNIILVQKNQDVVTSHVLIVEATGQYPESRFETVQGQGTTMRYEIVRTPADALDEKLMSQVRLAVGAQLGVPADDVIVVDGTLIPREFDTSDETRMNGLLVNTFNAVFTEMQIRTQDYRGTDVSKFLAENRGGKFQINVAYNESDMIFTDVTGMPVRQDVCISLSYKLAGQRDGWSVHQGENTVELCKTYGYIDFEFEGQSYVNNMPTTQVFIPNFIITHIESPFAPTPDIVMQAVLSVFAMNEGMNWLPAFRTSVSTKKGEIDLNDIGALNIEGNIEANPTGFGKKYDTKTKTMTNMELTQFVQRLVKPGALAISIDLTKAGPETWYTSLFHAIMFDDKNRVDALNRLNNFLIHSSGNVFQPNNIPLFVNTTNKIHGGYYKDVNRNYRDLRCVTNYLAVANFVNDTNQTPAKISQYTNTLYNLNFPAELRAAARREQYIHEMTNNSAVIKRYYDRVTFNAAYLKNYMNAMQSAGFNPIFASNTGANDMFVTRATGDFSGALLGQDARLMSAVGPVGYGQYNQFSAYHRSY